MRVQSKVPMAASDVTIGAIANAAGGSVWMLGRSTA